MRYKFSNDLMIKFSFNSEVRIPTSEELIGNGYSILASPALKPERTSGINLGILYRHIKTDGGLIEIELNGFYNQLKDMIRFTPDMIPTMARYRNFGSVRTRGIELEAKGDICPLLYIYATEPIKIFVICEKQFQEQKLRILHAICAFQMCLTY